MNIRRSILAFLIILVGTNIYFFNKNNVLRQDLSKKQDLCDEWLAKLRQQTREVATYTKVIKTQAAPASEQQQPLPIESVPEETDIETLVSVSHRMQAVTHKYEFLILSAQINDDEKELLKRLLLQRESLSNRLTAAEQQELANIDSLENKLYKIEDQIELVLNDPLDYYRYQSIKQDQL